MAAILGIAGSLRPGSISALALACALRSISERGVSTQALDLRRLNLPFCTGASTYPDYPDVELLRTAVSDAKGIVIVTPEYHGSMSGVLKNTLDLLTFEHIEGKVIAPISVLGGTHSMNALNCVRTVCRQLHAWVTPQQVMIPAAYEAFSPEGEPLDLAVKERIDALADALLISVEMLHKPS